MSSIPPVSSLNPLLKGLLSWIPGSGIAFRTPTAGGATASARYCYGVWLKHLCMTWRAGMRATPHTVIELGPGYSLGTGIAALLSGAERYVGIDSVRHTSASSTAAVLAELVTLFLARAPRPTKGCPDYDDELDARLFPSAILTEERLAAACARERLSWMQRAVARLDTPTQDPRLRYLDRSDADPVAPGEADLVFSHVVLNVADDLEQIYERSARWVRPGGWVSHQIDFSSLGFAAQWNGHLQYDERLWRWISGRRPIVPRRERSSAHLALLRKFGFELMYLHRGELPNGIRREQLAPALRDMSDEDLNCSTVLLVARKRG